MKTKITFKLESDSYIAVLRNGEQIGQIWSEQESGTTPYPHDESEYCLNAIQICGFDTISEVWGCGPFQGKKDTVVHFRPLDNEYYKRKLDKYSQYVRNFFEAKKSELKTGAETMEILEVEPKMHKDIKDLLSFEAWLVRNPI